MAIGRETVRFEFTEWLRKRSKSPNKILNAIIAEREVIIMLLDERSVVLEEPKTFAEFVFYEAFDGKCVVDYPAHIDYSVDAVLKCLPPDMSEIYCEYVNRRLAGKKKMESIYEVAALKEMSSSRISHQCDKARYRLADDELAYYLVNGRMFTPYNEPNWRSARITYLGVRNQCARKLYEMKIHYVGRLFNRRNFVRDTLTGKNREDFESAMYNHEFVDDNLCVIVGYSRRCPVCNGRNTMYLPKWKYMSLCNNECTAKDLFPTAGKFYWKLLDTGMCYDCQSSVYNLPKPGEDWGKPMCKCKICGTTLFERNEGLCPVCDTRAYLPSKGGTTHEP